MTSLDTIPGLNMMMLDILKRRQELHMDEGLSCWMPWLSKNMSSTIFMHKKCLECLKRLLRDGKLAEFISDSTIVQMASLANTRPHLNLT